MLWRGNPREAVRASPDLMTDETIGPLAYPDSAILTIEQVAAWLQVSPRTVKAWPLPRLKLPGSTVRYSAGEVLAYLEGRKTA